MSDTRRVRLRAAALSLTVAIGLLAVKLVAYAWTGSAAVLSDALESTVNVVAAIFLVYVVRLASKPADDDHPYGHGKAEDFGAGAEGALIVIAALGILWESIPRFWNPRALEGLTNGSALVAGAAVINLVVGAYLIRVGKRHASAALVADGKHLLTDVVTSVGALAALLVVAASGWLWVDPLIACLVAVYIIASGVRLVRGSVSRLMDEADDDLLEDIAASLPGAWREPWVDVHHLRAWRAGSLHHVDLHLTLPRFFEVERAHAEGSLLRKVLERGTGRELSTIVHIDPCRSVHCPQCALADCPVRAAEFVGRPDWDRDRLTGPPPEEGEQRTTPGARKPR